VAPRRPDTDQRADLDVRPAAAPRSRRAAAPEQPVPAAEPAALLRERLEDIVRLASDWIWETDGALILTSVSQRVLEVLGYHPRELIGRSILSLVAADTPPTALLQGFAKLAPFREIACEAHAKNGERRTLSLNATPVFDRTSGALAGFRGAASDITLLRERETSLRAAKEAAEMASRTKSEFLANTSHELRTPLNAIIGFAEILKMELLGPIGNSQYSGYVADIHTSAKHLLALINDILEVSRLQSGQSELSEERVHVPGLVAAAMHLIEERAGAGQVRLAVVIDENVPPVLADYVKLKRILFCLMSNAVKFTPSGGNVTLSARVAPDGALLVAVADTGIGIARHDLQRVLEPFTQADGRHTRRYDGTGLGLTLSRGLAESHGGSLELDSELGVGTTATLRLPPERLKRD